MVLPPDGPAIDVEVWESADRPAQWSRMDEFEGPVHERVRTTVNTAGGDVEAYLHVLTVPEEHSAR